MEFAIFLLLFAFGGQAMSDPSFKVLEDNNGQPLCSVDPPSVNVSVNLPASPTCIPACAWCGWECKKSPQCTGFNVKIDRNVCQMYCYQPGTFEHVTACSYYTMSTVSPTTVQPELLTTAGVTVTKGLTIPTTQPSSMKQTTTATPPAIATPPAAPSPPCTFVVVGCFFDNTNNRDLPNGFIWDLFVMTHEYCFKHCQSLNYVYAGLQYGDQCYCGNTYGGLGPATNCNKACSGNSRQMCGGNSANTVVKC